MAKYRHYKGTNKLKCIGKAVHLVSVRLPEEAYAIIDSYHGKNFSNKLVNYIFDHEGLLEGFYD